MLQLVELVEKKVDKKIIHFSVRFPAEQFDRMERHLNALPRDERPTKQGFITDAIDAAIENSADVSASVKSASSNVRYSETTQSTERELACFQQLEAILRVKSTAATEAVAAMLSAFVALLEGGDGSRDRRARADVVDEVQGAISGATNVLRAAGELGKEADRVSESLGEIAPGGAKNTGGNG